MDNFKQHNHSTISPCIIVEDVAKSIDFYTQAFKFEILEKHEREGIITGSTLKLGDTSFMIFSKKSIYNPTQDKTKESETENRNGMSLYVYCSDVDTLYQNALAYGAKSLTEPQNAFWGDRFCRLLDINGYIWGFATYKKS